MVDWTFRLLRFLFLGGLVELLRWDPFSWRF